MEASVEFLLGNLKQLVIHHVDLITGAESELSTLKGELEKFKAILNEASRKHKKDEIFKKWERDIREAVYDIEDTIDTCVTHTVAERAKRASQIRNLFKIATRMNLATAVKAIREEKVKPLIDRATVDFANRVVADQMDDRVEQAREIRQKVIPNIYTISFLLCR